MKTDTIAAIASGLTYAGIGIIRISGAEAVEVADRIFHMKGKKLADQSTHTIHYGFVYDGEEKLDEALVLLMRAPHSFTAEETVEIQCHGGPWIMKKILSAAVSHGARPAEPGEFTKRAFLNGRIDLSQAEAVMGLIQSQNDFARNASLNQLSGSVSRIIRDLREKILYEVAFIEAALDDPEHISLENYREKLQEILKPIQESVHHLILTAENGRMVSEGIRTVILGRPNAGKSSLWNRLVGEERAIVTEIAGTTRDVLEEEIHLNGISLRLIDTAGIRTTENIVEKIGVQKAKEQADQADLLLYVVDSSEKLNENDREIMNLLKGRKSLVLLNKVDLPSVQTKEEIEEILGKPVIPVSAKDGTGMEKFEQELISMFDFGEIRQNNQVTITNIRHKNALIEAENSLRMVQESLDNGLPEDFFTIDLMSAYQSLGEIIGESVGEDLINKIFQKFCMGK